ncbi:MAG: PAS-domain containing protein [Dongiaceae bacterium]
MRVLRRTSLGRPAHYALIAVLVVAMGAAILAGITEYGRVSWQSRNATWIAIEAQFAHLRLSESVSSYAAAPDEHHRQVLSADLIQFQRQLPKLATLAQDAPGDTPQTIYNMLARLPDIVSRVESFRDGDGHGYGILKERLDSLRQPLGDMARASTLGEAGGLLSQDPRQSFHLLAAMFAVLIAGIGGLAALLFRKKNLIQDYDRRSLADARELDATRTRLEDAIESITDGFALFDADERLVLTNDRFRAMHRLAAPLIQHGRTLEEIVRAAVMQDIYRIDGNPEDWIARRVRQCREVVGPVELAMADGRTILASDRRTPQGGRVSILTDITEKRQAERVLESRLAAFESSLDGLAIIDSDGRLAYANRSYALMHGWPERDGYVGHPWITAYDSDERERFEGEILPDLRTAGVWRGEAIGLTADGVTFPQELTLRQLEDGGIVCVVRDTTERHEADDERARLREQFHLSQRSEALGRLAGGIAHDFNNILGVILGLGDLSLIELEPGHPVRARIERILKAGQRAKDLIEQILAYSRQTLGERTVIDLGADINGVLDILRATVPSTIDIVLSVAKSRCFVEAGRSQIEQVIMNLCVNAMHAIGQKQGRIDIWLETVDGRAVAAQEMSPAALRDSSSSGHVQPGPGRANILWMSTPAPRELIRLSIRDNGIGMDAATLAEIFQPFFTTKPSGTGTGLGLAAVHGIVTAYGGAIRVASEAGVGTQFDVFLPAADGSVEPVEETEELVVTGNRRGRILVVDDEVDLAAVVCAKLQNLGHDAVECHHPHKAWTLFRSDPHSFDLLFTDQTMPGMAGDQLAEALREIRPDLPVIICSGYGARVGEARLREIGAVALLSKPVTTATLARVVMEALEVNHAETPAPLKIVA